MRALEKAFDKYNMLLACTKFAVAPVTRSINIAKNGYKIFLTSRFLVKRFIKKTYYDPRTDSVIDMKLEAIIK